MSDTIPLIDALRRIRDQLRNYDFIEVADSVVETKRRWFRKDKVIYATTAQQIWAGEQSLHAVKTFLDDMIEMAEEDDV